jgi:CO dehydrogenase nickel-insertion accessory protein CooC1
VKDILTNALTANSKYTITDEMAIVVSGLAKLFVGEITEIGSSCFCNFILLAMQDMTY